MKEFKTALKKFLPKIIDAKEKNLNEADTRMRIRLLFAEVLGYDILEDITQEHMVQSHYVDLTIKYKDKIILFVEAKSVDTTLRDTHVYQATNYAATGGVNLCILTNGIDYRLYYLTWDKSKVENNLILSFNLITDDINEVAEKLFLLSKESFKKGFIDGYIAEVTSLEDKNLLQAMLSRRALTAVRLELKNITGHNIKNDAIEKRIAKLFEPALYDLAKACIKRQERRDHRSSEKVESVESVEPAIQDVDNT
ncbi:MAG: type I restriction enzyme HsdR N-terminal domain-containing protein [Candidatus Subteraquimicrobiales bacterium]|nr:type I restriction enzyme HsdR N-terminal domain-containing protein [Candidatus Subteraquimicrobiales bacterium]